ncbi:ubiquitin carboxyl-terminal hydrolase CYLD isoform X6 [Odontomachus brunneus]|uniref:ubiquitin carboxyl-terminal hydrolase CYLD isoform X6 n=1 Tax=Odontomachus brunneus TaxID=486640 RepID=UPI0013F202E1|nr:ubiquitin carboxyl-terminal hydrolase CYLD isoform X6 [Odontomachus brunneus]XP_032674066.1 ubiquitin carboxyl-terminal hydrolase CYLD isoform X6 [Odontomachus brunneus]XP_032674067.1 ubiquitin carboxyl-terminal hydrolase CYLD isoform X6 [Odontomachus brunneus]
MALPQVRSDTSVAQDTAVLARSTIPAGESSIGKQQSIVRANKGYICKGQSLESQETSETSSLIKEYFTCTHWNAIFATVSNICPYKETDTVSSNIEKTSLFLKGSTGTDYSNDKKKSVLDSTPAILLEQFTTFDDNKNNNRESVNMLKERQKIAKSSLENDVNNFTKNLDHALFKSAALQNIPIFVLEHKWSSDIESNVYSDVEEMHDRLSLLDYSKIHSISCLYLHLKHLFILVQISGNVSEKNEIKKFSKIENKEDLMVGSNVKVLLDSDIHYGVIRWIGTPSGISPDKLMAAVELDDGHPLGTDGTYKDIRYFHCRPHRAVFTDIEHCSLYENTKLDERLALTNNDNFGNMECSVIAGIVRPISVKGDLESICGKYRGIQGHHNSCYLDATLFSMFTFTSVFDNLLFRPPNEKDCPQYEEVQRVLREEIVNPLRKNMFVRADRVMKLRTLLEKLSSVSGLTSEEKDPEEFLTSLVAQILNAEPFLKLSSGQDAYHYQLFVEKDDHLNLPTVQQLLEQSFLTSNIRLKEVPSCLIIQMPRFGKSFKMYQKIQPTLLLDVTDIIEDSPRQCTVCGKLAEYECKECYGQCGVGLESIAFCFKCLEKVHCHERRTNHEPKKLVVPMEFAILQEHCYVPRLYLELSAVVCIETSHYVSFVKCGPGSEAPWCFFDSMADRKGEQNGYNIPEMVPCPDFPYWLSEEGGNYLTKLTDDRHLPEHAKRLLCDAYMCMYQSPDVMMYK